MRKEREKKTKRQRKLDGAPLFERILCRGVINYITGHLRPPRLLHQIQIQTRIQTAPVRVLAQIRSRLRTLHARGKETVREGCQANAAGHGRAIRKGRGAENEIVAPLCVLE